MSRPASPCLALCLAPCLAVALGGLAGCAQQGAFPSLAPRPIERIDEAEAIPTAPPVPAAADAALMARLTPILDAAETGHGRFLDELATARPIVERAAGAARGGEAWVAAHEALSRAEAARGALPAALADLDALRREHAGSPNPANRTALDRAAQWLAALDAEENAGLAALAGKLA